MQITLDAKGSQALRLVAEHNNLIKRMKKLVPAKKGETQYDSDVIMAVKKIASESLYAACDKKK